jgi:hypothetical protein
MSICTNNGEEKPLCYVLFEMKYTSEEKRETRLFLDINKYDNNIYL